MSASYSDADHRAAIITVLSDDNFNFAEIVLAELLSAFKFEDSGKPVVWNVGEVVYPTVGEDSTVPAFPMKVTAL